MEERAAARDAGARPEHIEARRRTARLPVALADHLERFLAGSLELARFRLEMANSLYEHPGLAADMPEVLDLLRDTGHLPEHIHEVLLGDIESIASEEVPTEMLAGESREPAQSATRHLQPPQKRSKRVEPGEQAATTGAADPGEGDHEPEADELPHSLNDASSAVPGDVSSMQVEHVEMGGQDRRYGRPRMRFQLEPETDSVNAGRRSDPTLRRLKKQGIGPGSVIANRLVLEERLAGGSLGEVYKASDRTRSESAEGGNAVAVKFVNEKVCGQPGAIQALHQQYARLKSLSHPGIVSVFEFNEFEGRPYLTMEWLDGESLAARLDRSRPRPMATELIREIARQIGDALEFAHEHGQVHGDLKPGNIFLGKDGFAKLMDFGLVRSSGSRAMADSHAVTRAYASPQVLEEGAPTESDDIFAFSCILYRMLAGRRAYGGMNALEAAVSQVSPRRIPGLSREAWKTLAGGLSFDPEKRPTSVTALVDPIFPAAPALGRGLRVAGLGAAALALGFGWWLGRSGPDVVLASLAQGILWAQGLVEQFSDLIVQLMP